MIDYVLKVYPEWKAFEFFATEKLQNVMRDDATLNTRPMTFYVEDPVSIAKLGDKIAYAKCKLINSFLHMYIN